MGNFKLGSDRPNVLKENGFLNKSPFTANGNTMAYNNGEGGPEPKKPSTQAETDEAAMNNVVFDESTRTEVESDKPGFKKFRTTGTGDAEGYTKGTKKMGNKEWSEWLKTPAGQKYTASKNKEKFDYVADPKKEPTEKMTYTTTENPRKKKTQDYIVGQGDRVFAPPSTQRFMGLSKALTGLTGRSRADLFGFKTISNEKRLQPYKDAHDKKVLDSRAVQGKLGKNTLTIQEQLDFQKAHGGLNPNQLGGGDSRIVDTKSGKGQTTTNQNIVKDAQGNMIVQTFNKRGKVISTKPLSPENDINTEKATNKANATTLSGRETVVTTSKV